RKLARADAVSGVRDPRPRPRAAARRLAVGQKNGVASKLFQLSGRASMPAAIRLAFLVFLPALVVACADSADPSDPTATAAVDANQIAPEASGQADEKAGDTAQGSESTDFDAFVDDLIADLLRRSPEWAIYQGRYENAGTVTIPDARHRREELQFIERSLTRLHSFDRDSLPVDRRTDYELLENRLESMRFYTQTLKSWEWQPS